MAIMIRIALDLCIGFDKMVIFIILILILCSRVIFPFSIVFIFFFKGLKFSVQRFFTSLVRFIMDILVLGAILNGSVSVVSWFLLFYRKLLVQTGFVFCIIAELTVSRCFLVEFLWSLMQYHIICKQEQFNLVPFFCLIALSSTLSIVLKGSEDSSIPVQFLSSVE